MNVKVITAAGAATFGAVLFALPVLAGAVPPQSQAAVHTVDGSTTVRTAVQATGNGYPAVVARVDGKPISGQMLAQRMVIVSSNQPQLSKPQAEHEALESLIQDAVLIQQASKQGLTISDGQVRSYVQSVAQSILNSSNDPEAKATLKAAASGLGISPGQYAQDPRVLSAYKADMTRGRMVQHILASLSPQQRSDPAAVKAAIAAFVAQSGARVERLITA